MTKKIAIFSVAVMVFWFAPVVNFVSAEEMSREEIQKLIIGVWTWSGDVSDKELKIIFEFLPDGKLNVNKKEQKVSILYPPEAIKKFLKGTLSPNSFFYEIKDRKIKIYLSSDEEIRGNIISISAITMKINIKIGDSDLIFILRNLENSKERR